MNKEKQIEEIRKDIFAAFGGYAKWEEDWQLLAEAVYNAGYRKQSKKYLLKENGDIVPLSKQSEWISVEERLPESECPVLIFTRKNRYYVGYYYKALIDQTFTGFYADDVRRDVTYWMPLPEPPKKGGAE